MPLTADDVTVLYRDHARRLTGFFVRRTHDPDAAVDLVAETFAMAVRDRGKFRGDPEEAAVAWLYSIAGNLLNGWYRQGFVERRAMSRLGIERPELEDVERERIIELGGLAQERERAAAILRSLPEPQRDAIKLRVIEERSYDEVARALGISQQTARARVSRGLRALATSMTEAAAHG